jgi:hypothetical protein
MIASTVFTDGKSTISGYAVPIGRNGRRGATPQPGFTDWNTLADDGFGSVHRPCIDGPK